MMARGVSLPEDIVFDVLTRVPAKDLCRFWCVCKAWHALISDLAFVAAQRSRAGPHLIGVFPTARPSQGRVMDMDGNILRVFEVQVISKKDDVLGVLRPAAAGYLIYVQGARTSVNDAMIIDPAAGRACTVGLDTPFATSSFGRTASCSALTFIIYLKQAFPSQICEVATIVKGSGEQLTWRQRLAPPFLTRCFTNERATVNGVVYFMAGPNKHHDGALNSASNRIAAFDVESDEWKRTNGPAFDEHDETGYAYVTLTEHKGTLGVVRCVCKQDGHYYANIWLLIDFNKSVWVKEYTIQVPRRWRLVKVLWALDDGRILMRVSKLEEDYRDVLVFYNRRTKTFIEPVDKVTIGFSDILVLYTGSLLS